MKTWECLLVMMGTLLYTWLLEFFFCFGPESTIGHGFDPQDKLLSGVIWIHIAILTIVLIGYAIGFSDRRN